MILDLLKPKSNKLNIGKENKIAMYKAVTWRILGTIDTIVISFILTGEIKIALSIGGFEVFTKMVLYFFHEKLWARWSK